MSKKETSFLVFLLLTLILLGSSCLNLGVCENTSEKEVISPNGKLKAVIYDRGCGATTGFITVISILPANEKLQNDDEMNVLFAENVYIERSSDNNNQIKYGKTNFDVKWNSDDELKVFYTPSKNLSKHDKFNNINIKYELIK